MDGNTEDFQRLLKGQITPAEYVDRLKIRVEENRVNNDYKRYRRRILDRLKRKR
jgi:hypothetical protein